MGGLFKKPKAPPPDPKIEENLREQELAAEQERIVTGKKLAAQCNGWYARSRNRVSNRYTITNNIGA